jgi:hypothetical protein
MTLFTVDGDGVPLGVAATATPEAAINLVRLLCRAHELATEGRCATGTISGFSVRPANLSEEMKFQNSAMSGCVRLAGILLFEDMRSRPG